ncbi:MAG: hypothetical protein IKK48_03155 [Firmicutes bacterium]|nr:hypothetical protein [Bacillota bacterium]
MDKKWPFGFFVYSSLDGKEEGKKEAEVVMEPEAEPVKVVWAETPAAIVVETETAEEVFADDFDEEEETLPDLEEELEIALETAHQEEVKKQRLIKGITAGVAILGAVGLAAGLSIRTYLKKK